MTQEALKQRLDVVAKARLEAIWPQVSFSLKQIAAGNPLGAEPDEARMTARLAHKTGVDTRQAESMAAAINQAAVEIGKGVAPPDGREAVWDTADFMGVEFFTRGRRAANAVGRVVFKSGRVQGSGFLVGPGLLLTNNHVLTTAAMASSMCVQFDFESDEFGIDRSISVFDFDPAACFVSAPVEGLDFTLIALGPRLRGESAVEGFGYLPLSDSGDKHMLGEYANIIQHPEGRLKQIVLRNNNLVARDETTHVLHYVADTQRGSSGSPVLNNEWEPIALHHWAGAHLERRTADGRQLRRDVNEGIRVSSIVAALRDGVGTRDARSKQAIAEVLALWDTAERLGPVVERPDAGLSRGAAGLGGDGTRDLRAGARTNADGSTSYIFPIEITVRAPLLDTPRAPVEDAPRSASVPATEVRTEPSGREDADDYSDRGGYEPGFIPGFQVPLPDFSNVPYRVARNQEATGNDDEHELRYHHFSIVMNADRRLASFTACNIDGSRIKAINRETKVVTDDPTLKQLDAESLGPEASDDFRPDPRVLDDEQMAREFYEEQEVPGFPKPVFPGHDAPEPVKKAYYRAMLERTARMLQKGHIVLRIDPAWGTHDEALGAENDTFHYTNAAPQLGFFNQGSREDHPGEKGKLRWRTVETFVLRNAVTTRQRICVFAGPVFRNDDPDYRNGSKIPMKFWKVAVWAEDGELRSVALLADQQDVLDRLTEGVPEAFAMHGAEAFDDPDELDRVTQFLTTVEHIESLTMLDFGSGVRNGDIRAGGSERAGLDDAVLRRTTTRKK